MVATIQARVRSKRTNMSQPATLPSVAVEPSVSKHTVKEANKYLFSLQKSGWTCEQFQGAHTPVRFTCAKGHAQIIAPRVLLLVQDCHTCASKQRYTDANNHAAIYGWHVVDSFTSHGYDQITWICKHGIACKYPVDYRAPLCCYHRDSNAR